MPPVKSPLRIAGEHDGVLSLVSAVAAGTGVAVVSDSVTCLTAPGRLKLVPLSPEPKPLMIGVILPKTGLPPAAACFFECIKAAIAQE